MSGSGEDDEECEQSHADFLGELTAAEHEIKDIISYLILRRELIRDEALERLERETTELVARLEKLNGAALLEELACFKDVLALHRQSIEEHGRQGN